MAASVFKVGQTIDTEVGQIEVATAAPNDPNLALAIGRHRFQLVVEDDRGNKSEPVIAEVEVVKTTFTPIVVQPIDIFGPRIVPRPNLTSFPPIKKDDPT